MFIYYCFVRFIFIAFYKTSHALERKQTAQSFTMGSFIGSVLNKIDNEFWTSHLMRIDKLGCKITCVLVFVAASQYLLLCCFSQHLRMCPYCVFPCSLVRVLSASNLHCRCSISEIPNLRSVLY